MTASSPSEPESAAPPHHRLLLVCTANQCRSAMATVLARAWLEDHGVAGVSIESAGTMAGADGRSASDGALRAMKKRDLDLADHVSQPVGAEMVEAADLVLAMERRHVRALVNLEPAAYPRIYTLLEFARRVTAIGPRPAGVPMADWLGEVHAGRSGRNHLGRSSDDDIHDPIGRRRVFYDRCADEITTALAVSLTAAFGCDAVT